MRAELAPVSLLNFATYYLVVLGPLYLRSCGIKDLGEIYDSVFESKGLTRKVFKNQ